MRPSTTPRVMSLATASSRVPEEISRFELTSDKETRMVMKNDKIYEVQIPVWALEWVTIAMPYVRGNLTEEERKILKTLVFETGAQNTGLGMTIAMLTWGADDGGNE